MKWNIIRLWGQTPALRRPSSTPRTRLTFTSISFSSSAPYSSSSWLAFWAPSSSITACSSAASFENRVWLSARDRWFDPPSLFADKNRVFLQQMSPEDYACLVRQQHEYIKTGTMTPCMRPKASNHPSDSVGQRDERRFTLDQSQIIKCNDSDTPPFTDSVFLDRL